MDETKLTNFRAKLEKIRNLLEQRIAETKAKEEAEIKEVTE